MSTDHLGKAKDYIAIAESADSKTEAYHRAADEIFAWLAEDRARTCEAAAKELGKGKSYVTSLLKARRTGAAPTWASGSNKRGEVARKVLRDPVQRREVIESLEPEERAELVREVGRSATPPASDSSRDDEREVFRSIEDAPEHDVSALAARFVATSSRLDLVLREGGEFKRMDATDLQRLDRDLDRVKDTVDRAKEQIVKQSRVRRIA